MKRLNVLHPWLPQSPPPSQATYPHLDEEIQDAERLVKKEAKRVSVLRRKYQALQKRLVGPSTIEMVILTGQYRRSQQEFRLAKEKLQRLIMVKRFRKNGKAGKK